MEIQFQITAWKHNGTALETSSLKIISHIPSLSGATTFAAPTGLAASFDHDENAATPLDDGRVRLDWVEASNSELFYQIQLAKAVTAPAEPAFNHVAFLPINTTRYILNDSTKLGLIPGDS